MRSLALAAALCLAGGAAFSQDASQAADHAALRKLKDDVVRAINTRDLDNMDRFMHQPFVATVVTQDSFTDGRALKAYFDGLFSRSVLRISRLTIAAEADELSQIYTGTVAVARGSTKERYELGDGRIFDLAGRWTGVAIKDDGGWKLLAVHTGTNFLDNPVLTAVEKTTVYFGGAGLAIGAPLGFLVGFFVRRRRA
jgi:ketosteroid isomerase-like protein